MAVSEEDIIRDTNERNDLQMVIASTESAIADSVPGTGTRRVLENLIEQSKKRITVLEKRIDESTRERATETQAQNVAIARLAEQETKLSGSEKETYSGFLKEEFFTKKDFGKLETFYAHTWDRLSEGGKDEMSHRIWEGIRRDEYRFTDLPRIVQEKEEDRVYAKLTNAAKKQDSLEQIPQTDQTDFIRAYETGNRKEAGQILNRDSFKQNLNLGKSAGARHEASTIGKAKDDQAVLTEEPPKSRESSPDDSSAMASVNSVSAKLKDIELVDSPPEPSVATLPDALASRNSKRGSSGSLTV